MSAHGIEIKNRKGQILIDDEHVLPKLYHHGSIALTQTEEDEQGRTTRYGVFEFSPTKQPVFATYAINENTTPNAKLRYIQVRRNSEGYYYGIYIGAAPDWQATVYVWVYLL